MPRSNPTFWATDSPSSSSTAAVDAAAVPLDAALSHTRAALERHRQFPDDLGIISEAIQKLRVSEAALKIQLQAPGADSTVAKALQKRLAQSERQRKELERKAGGAETGEPQPSGSVSPTAERAATPPARCLLHSTRLFSLPLISHPFGKETYPAEQAAGELHRDAAEPLELSRRRGRRSGRGAVVRTSVAPQSAGHWP